MKIEDFQFPLQVFQTPFRGTGGQQIAWEPALVAG